MSKDDDWHTFDVEKSYEIRIVFGLVEVRQNGEHKARLTQEEFDQWREKGANPEGLT